RHRSRLHVRVLGFGLTAAAGREREGEREDAAETENSQADSHGADFTMLVPRTSGFRGSARASWSARAEAPAELPTERFRRGVVPGPFGAHFGVAHVRAVGLGEQPGEHHLRTVAASVRRHGDLAASL